MRRLCVALAAIAGLLLIAAPADAGLSGIEVTGELGPGGQAEINGTGCGPQGSWQVIFYKVLSEDTFTVAGPGGGGPAEADGTWSFTLPIPDTVITGDEYMISASCTRDCTGEPCSFSYDEFFFTMGEAVTPTTDTTATPDTTAGSGPDDPAPSAAAAAAATPTSPRLTG